MKDWAMTDELENQLRRALRPVDAPEGFTARLMQRLPPAAAGGKAPVVVALPAPRARRRTNYALPAALAASLVAAVMLGQHMGQQIETGRQQRELAEGRAASRELMEALRVTSQKLDLAYQAVNSLPSAPAPGEEENPS
jgi:hypothetical protein